MKPRYTVGTVTGWPITEASLSNGKNVRTKPSTIAYVYDSAYCYRPIAVFPSRGSYGERNKMTNVEAAHALAAELNAKEHE